MFQHPLSTSYSKYSNLFVLLLFQDFGDGGAFPEIMVAQYPLGMGRERKAKSTALPVQMDIDGKIKYDNLLRTAGQPKDKVIHSRFSDLVEKQVKASDDDPDLARPSDEKIKEVIFVETGECDDT